MATEYTIIGASGCVSYLVSVLNPLVFFSKTPSLGWLSLANGLLPKAAKSSSILEIAIRARGFIGKSAIGKTLAPRSHPVKTTKQARWLVDQLFVEWIRCPTLKMQWTVKRWSLRNVNAWLAQKKDWLVETNVRCLLVWGRMDSLY